MTKIDQFESAFKAAAKTPFAYEEIRIPSILVVTDKDTDGAAAFAQQARTLVPTLADENLVQWRTVTAERYENVQALLDIVQAQDPGMLCTYRHLRSTAWRWPYSLGAYLDVLTQVTPAPVLVLPHPERMDIRARLRPIRSVMAVTDHLTGDHRLVNYAIRFVGRGGTLWLTHVEDKDAFERHMGIIAKLPSIDTEQAREAILRLLLKEPHDYILSCRAAIQETEALDVRVEEEVVLGKRLVEYKRLVTEHAVDLLVMNTKDRDQLAMHGMAYPLAVELRDLPILML